MYVLRIEHPGPDYEIWKQVLATDIIRQEISGLCRYHILKPVNGATFLMVDFEFENLDHAQSFHIAMKQVWRSLGDKAMRNPGGRIFEVVETSVA